MPTDQLSLTFAALADPTRRAILTRLAEGEATVNELAEPFPMSLPAISRHLKVLERAGLIVRSREAQWRPSRLEAEPLDEAVEWMQSRKQTWEARMDRLDAPLRQKGEQEECPDPHDARRSAGADHAHLRRPARARLQGLDRSRRGRRVVRTRAHGHAARADQHRPARRRSLRAHDGPARRRRRVLDRLRDRRAGGAR